MKIRTPSTRAYYPASRSEKDRLLCWAPQGELARMVQDGHIAQDVLDDYPDGLEFEVSKSAFNEFQIDLGISPEALSETYAELLAQGLLPDSGRVDGASLERVAQERERSGLGAFTRGVPEDVEDSIRQKLPEPEMTDGEDPMTVMLSLH